MFKLDNAFLEQLGLGSLPPVEKNKMLAHIYETLEMRVGMKLAENMSNEQLDEFESYIKQKDEAGALRWLESNFPDYKQVVSQELEKLKAEIAQVAPQIVSQFANSASAQQITQPQEAQIAGQQAPYPQPNPSVAQPQQYQPAPNYQQPPTSTAPPTQPTPVPPITPQQQFQSQSQPQAQSQQSAYPDPSTVNAGFGSQPSYAQAPFPPQQQSPVQPVQSQPQPTQPTTTDTNYQDPSNPDAYQPPVTPQPWQPQQ